MEDALRKLSQIDWEHLSDQELLTMHQQLLQWQGRLQQLVEEVADVRAHSWWSQLPAEDARTIRLLLKGGRLTPQLLKHQPALSHLMLLVEIDNPDVVRLWAKMTPESRAERIEDLRTAILHTEVRRTTSEREDEQESRLLAYEVLGLTPSASWSDVKKRYRDLAAKHHPDQGGDALIFMGLQKAYRLLENRYL